MFSSLYYSDLLNQNQRGRRKVLKDHQACLVAHWYEFRMEDGTFRECGRSFVLLCLVTWVEADASNILTGLLPGRLEAREP